MMVIDDYSRVKSLLELCVGATVVGRLRDETATVRVLPAHLKSRLLARACSLGLLTPASLDSLLHPGVRRLNLGGTRICDDTLGVVAKCRQLKYLDLNVTGQNHLGDVTTTALTNMFSQLDSLSSIYMKNCPAVTDDVIATIVTHCRHLTVLDVGGCRAITDASLTTITSTSCRVKSLNFSWSQVSEVGLLTLAQGICGESLEELQLENCRGVTTCAVEAISKHCKNLKIFQIQGCLVTDAAWHALDSLILRNKMQQLTWTVY